MKWYQAALNRIIKGIMLFLLPVMLLLFIFGKAIDIVQGIIHPIKNYLPDDTIMGVGLITLISILLILLLCYLAGILSEKKGVKKFVTAMEDNVLVFIPGYAMIKSRAGEAVGHTDDEWKVVMVGEDDDWKLGIEVDKQPGGYCTIFFPEPPDAKSGEMKLIHESKLKPMDMPVSKLVGIIRKYGQGASALVEK